MGQLVGVSPKKKTKYILTKRRVDKDTGWWFVRLLLVVIEGGDRYERYRKSNCIGKLGARVNWVLRFYEM